MSTHQHESQKGKAQKPPERRNGDLGKGSVRTGFANELRGAMGVEGDDSRTLGDVIQPKRDANPTNFFADKSIVRGVRNERSAWLKPNEKKGPNQPAAVEPETDLASEGPIQKKCAACGAAVPPSGNCGACNSSSKSQPSEDKGGDESPEKEAEKADGASVDTPAQFKLVPVTLPKGKFNERKASKKAVTPAPLVNNNFEAPPPPAPSSEDPQAKGKELLDKGAAETAAAQGNPKKTPEKKNPEIQGPDKGKKGPAAPGPEPKTQKPKKKPAANGIPDSVRAKMEAVFDIDVSTVNIVQNSQEATQAGALAFAKGNTVHFAPGQFNPETPKGQELLGHELAHVVQQRQGRVKPTGRMEGLDINDSPQLEKEADALGQQAAALKEGNETHKEGEEAGEQSEKKRSPAPQGDGREPVAQLQDDGSRLYATYTQLLQWAETEKGNIKKDTVTLKKKAQDMGDGHKQAINDLMGAEIQKMKDAIKTTTDAVNTSTTNARTSITTTKDTKIKEVTDTAATEIQSITDLIKAKKKDITTDGETYSTDITSHGDAEALRAINGSKSNASQLDTVINENAASYSDREGIEEAVSKARSNAGDTKQKLTDMGDTMAFEAKRDATNMALDIRKEAADICTQFDQPLNDSARAIEQKRDETLEALRGSGDSFLTNLEKEAQESVTALQGQIPEQETKLRTYAEGTIETVDTAVKDTQTMIDQQMQQSATDLDQFIAQLQEIGWHSKEIEAARVDLETALKAHRGDIDKQIESMKGKFDQHKGEVQSGTEVYSTALKGTCEQVTKDFDTEVSTKATEITDEMTTMARDAVAEMQTVKPNLEPELDNAITETREKWDDSLEDGKSGISTKVDSGLERQSDTVSDFSSRINDEFSSLPSKERSIWDSLWDSLGDALSFLGGVFVGIFEGLWELLKGIWEIIITPAKWLIAAVVIIAAVILIAIVAAVAGISFGLAALIVGAIVGIGFMAYYFYKAATTEGLTPYERGKLVGRGIFEGLMAFAGTGVWARLGSWAGRIGKLSSVVSKVGGLGKFLKMAVWVDDIDRLILVINKVENVGEIASLFGRLSNAKDAAKLLDVVEHLGDVSKLATFFGKSKNVAAVISKIDDLAAFTRIMDRVADAEQLVNILKVGKFKSITQLEELMLLTSIRDLDTLARVLENTGSVENLMDLARRIQKLTMEEAQNAVANLSGNKRGPVQTGVLDTKFPGAGGFFGRNADLPPADLYPMLRDILAEYLPLRDKNLLTLTGEELDKLIKAGVAGSHSEVYALSQALWNRHKAMGLLTDQVLPRESLAEFLLNNVALKGSRTLTGAPPRCPNCNFLTNGVTLTGVDEASTFAKLFNGQMAGSAVNLAELADPNVFRTVFNLLRNIMAPKEEKGGNQ